MTLREAQAHVRKLGMVIKTTQYNEYRVNYKKGKEATAYYAADLDDAVATAEDMAKRKGNPRRKYRSNKDSKKIIDQRRKKFTKAQVAKAKKYQKLRTKAMKKVAKLKLLLKQFGY